MHEKLLKQVEKTGVEKKLVSIFFTTQTGHRQNHTTL